MVNRVYWLGSVVVAGLISCLAQHYHVNAGAEAVQAGTKLLFVNGAEFATNSGFFVRMARDTNGGFAGEYVGALSLTALSADPLAPEPGHALPGSYLEVVMESVEGPTGGSISFWQRPEGTTQSERLFSVPSGTVAGTNRWNLSEGDGSAGSDPFGHIHGRNFTASAEGLYRVGLRIVDSAGNGPGGGPLHAPSDLFYLWFQAGVLLQQVKGADGKHSVVFPAVAGRTWQLEKVWNMEWPWEPLGAPVAGDDRFKAIEVNADETGFYRLRAN
jgi:hypothetical protein